MAVTGDLEPREPRKATTVRLLVLQQVVPGYREAFFRGLVGRVGQLTIASSDATNPVEDPAVTWRRTWHSGPGRIALQSLSLAAFRNADVVVVEMNPRLLTTWLVLVACRISGRRSVLWGHRESRRGTRSRLRKMLERLGDAVVYYTEAELAREHALGSTANRFAAPNTVSVRYVSGTDRSSGVMLSSRLTPDKDPLLAVEAVASMTRPYPTLHVVGDGPLRADVERRAAELGVPVAMHGALWEDRERSELYSQCFAALSPGYVGLSLNQAVLSGVPLIYRADAAHSPEIAFATDDNSVAVTGNAGVRWGKTLDFVRQRSTRQAADALAAESSCTLPMHRMVEGMLEAIEAVARTSAPRLSGRSVRGQRQFGWLTTTQGR